LFFGAKHLFIAARTVWHGLQSSRGERVPRGAGAPPITAANVPPISDSPPASALITFTGGQVNIPN
jgi:hydroxybutyrate-dimer hydrolase